MKMAKKNDMETVSKEVITLQEGFLKVLKQYHDEKLSEGNMTEMQVLCIIASALLGSLTVTVENMTVFKQLMSHDFDSLEESLARNDYHPKVKEAIMPIVRYMADELGATVSSINNED